jgi:hypothetical protein
VKSGVKGGEKMDEEIKSFSELFGRQTIDFEGERVELLDVLKKEIVIRDFALLPSAFEEGTEFAVVQAEMNKRLVTFACGSKVLIEQLKKIKNANALPIKVTIVREKSKSGRSYYTMK